MYIRSLWLGLPHSFLQFLGVVVIVTLRVRHFGTPTSKCTPNREPNTYLRCQQIKGMACRMQSSLLWLALTGHESFEFIDRHRPTCIS